MNVLLVDDDFFVINALEKRIDWAALSIRNIYTAYNVAQAREILDQHAIDILICDIEMPQGSGLELLAGIRGGNHNVQAIILTNYADFNYAQKAIELQSFDYFLKPIEFDKLTLIIQKAISKAKEQQMNEKVQQKGYLWQKHQKNMLEDFWRRVILGKDFPSTPYSDVSFVGEQNLHYRDEDLFLPLLVTLFPYDRSLGKEDKILFDYAILNVMYESFQDPHFSIETITEIKDNNLMMILKWNNEPQLDVVEALCSSFIKQANQFLKSDACCNIALSRTLGHIRTTIRDLLRMNEEIVKCRNRTFLLEQFKPREDSYIPPDLTLLEHLLKEHSYTAFLEEIHSYLQGLLQRQILDASVLSLFRLDIIQLVYAYLKNNEIQAHQLYTRRTGDQLFNQSLNSVEDMQKYITYLVNTAAEHRQFAEHPKSVVEEVKKYILNNYNKDLTRTNLAESVYLNPDYLARIFKKETGISLGSLIIRTRISMAKQLLETTQLTVNMIAAKVGYSNYSHFAKLFKQVTQCSPNEYRKIRTSQHPPLNQ